LPYQILQTANNNQKREMVYRQRVRPCHPASLQNSTRLFILPEEKLKRFTSLELLFVSALTPSRRNQSSLPYTKF
jgi:hypothetical protein